MIDLAPNLTIFPMWFLFVVVLVVLNRWVFQPTLALLDERKNQTERQEQNAQHLLEETQKRLASYEEAILQARNRAAVERERIVNEAHEQEKAIIDQARSDTEKVLDDIKTKVEGEKGGAILKLRQEAQGLARSIVDKVLERDKKVA